MNVFVQLRSVESVCDIVENPMQEGTGVSTVGTQGGL